MPRSMTGFGRAETDGHCHRLTVEVRSINHRFMDVSVHLPRQLSWWEPRVREAVSAAVSRGRVEVFLDVRQLLPPPRELQVDTDLAVAYHKSLEELSVKLGLEGRPDVNTLALMPDIFTLQDLPSSYQAEEPHLDRVLSLALDGLGATRELEGARLAGELVRLLGEVTAKVAVIRERAPVMVGEFRGRMERRIKDLGLECDADRLATEVAYYAERADVAEEILRLESHLAQAGETLRQGGAVGRKLVFILQEMNREINTVGSKASDVTVGEAVVEVKTRLEQMRELVQNLE